MSNYAPPSCYSQQDHPCPSHSKLNTKLFFTQKRKRSGQPNQMQSGQRSSLRAFSSAIQNFPDDHNFSFLSPPRLQNQEFGFGLGKMDPQAGIWTN